MIKGIVSPVGATAEASGNAPLMTAAFLEKLDWDRIQKDKSTFEDFAKKGNIPLPKLREIFDKKGVTRSEIEKETLALLTKTIKSQDDLAQLFKFENGAMNEENKDGKSCLLFRIFFNSLVMLH